MKTTGLNLILVVLVCLLSAGLAWGQATSSLRGTVKDPTGAVVPEATVKLVNTRTGLERTTATSSSGDYHFPEVIPDPYRLEVLADGFRRFEVQNVKLLVNTPATINVDLEVGERTDTVAVTAEAQELNTTDASLGIAFTENQVKQLPMEARNVPDLLSLQAGVIYTGNRPDINKDIDTRSGAVNGARSDQSNITLDGVDVNDQGNGYAFTSVLPVTLDSVQEFRVTTSNYNANQGRSSGAQVSLVTKGGSNEFHGSLYEYHRNTVTSANDYFIKRAQLSSDQPNEAPKLLRNIFGGSLGGPLKKDRLFFFLNYEGRRDRQEESVLRNVPSATLRQGIVQYQNVDGGITTLTPANLTAMDPLHLGPNPAVLQFFQSYPLPNDNSVGDGLNYSGFRFKGPVARRFDYYIARLDYKLTDTGNHTLFWRGSLQNVSNPGAPFLPGTTALHTQVDYSKGFVAGYTAVLRPTVVNNFRWGWTRQSSGDVGRSNEPWIFFRGLQIPNQAAQGVSHTRNFQLPVHNFVDDLSWVKGRHSLQFGTNLYFIRNPRFSQANSFSYAVTNASWLTTAGIANTGIELDPAVNGFPAVNSDFANAYDYPVMDMMGIVSEVDGVYNYDKSGNLLSQGAPVKRHFANDGYEFYIQDSFRWKPNLTINYGLRYQLFSPPWETNGLQVAPSFSLGNWFTERGLNMLRGIPSNQDPLVTFDLAGPANGRKGFYDWDKNNFAPRLSIAYSPRPSSGWLKRITGDGDKMVIRAGGGIVYDHIGQGLLSTFDLNGAFGLATTLTNPAGVQTLSSAPRLTSVNVLPTTDSTGQPILIPAPPGTFPQTPPATLDSGGFAITWGLDDTIKTPYSYVLDASVGRELPHGFSLEVSYVGRLSHKLLTQEDLAMPLDLVDPKSGVNYFSAASRLSQLSAAGTPTDSVTPSLVGPTAAYWGNMLQPLQPGGAYACSTCSSGSTTNPVVAAYDLFSGFLYNETTALFVLDYFGIPDANLSDALYFPIGGTNSFWNPQYSSLYAWRTRANANYHAMQLNLRKRMSQGVQLDFNYTFSKSIDLSSDAERIDFVSGLGGQVINSWAHKQLRAVSDFDVAHQLNANWIVELPFGNGRRLGRNAYGFLEALIGGWQLSGLYRWTSGFPVNVFNGATWPTNWELGGEAFKTGPVVTRTTKSDSGVNIFPDPNAAINAFRHALPGESGGRNLVRGDGFFGIDMGLSKRWKMPWAEKQSLQFRWEVFNISNSTRFDVQSNTPSIDQVTAFGKYTGLLTQPRIMQFALRYEF